MLDYPSERADEFLTSADQPLAIPNRARAAV